MFAPPPIQLSRPDIEQRLAESEDGFRPRTSPRHRPKSRSPNSPSKRRFFARGSKQSALQSVVTSESLDSSPEVSPAPRAEVEHIKLLPPGFAERPRKAPAPPIQLESTAIAATAENAPPPIPEKSARRAIASSLIDQHIRPMYEHGGVVSNQRDDILTSQSTNAGRNTSPPGALVTSAREADLWFTAPIWTKTEPVADRNGSSFARNQAKGHQWTSISPIQSSFAHGRQTGVRAARVQKTTLGRSPLSAGLYRSQYGPDSRSAGEQIMRRATEADVQLESSMWTAPEAWAVAPRAAELVRAQSVGGHSVHYVEEQSGTGLDGALFRSIVDRISPDTPSTFVATPTEMIDSAYASPARTFEPAAVQTPFKPRSGHDYMSQSRTKAHSSLRGMQGISPSRLSAILEGTIKDKNSMFAPGGNSRMATRIQLREGSLLTVSPPELTPWKQVVYTQGPIKLPKPVIIPRKNSVASLEPFQEAVEQMYQSALSVPRRRSDDRVLDDVCDFFDEFGFGSAEFKGDAFVQDWNEFDEEEEVERFSTPSIEVSPVERAIAKRIFEAAGQLYRPPETHSAVRNAGGTRLKHGVPRKDSVTLSEYDAAAFAAAYVLHAAARAEGGEIQTPIALLSEPSDSVLAEPRPMPASWKSGLNRALSSRWKASW